MRSTVELLGRKQLAPGEDLPLTPADPASRILEALLEVPDQAERLQLLPEALQPTEAVTVTAEVPLRVFLRLQSDPREWMLTLAEMYCLDDSEATAPEAAQIALLSA